LVLFQVWRREGCAGSKLKDQNRHWSFVVGRSQNPKV